MRVALVGRGRLGWALTQAMRAAGVSVLDPHGRGFDGSAADLVLLCVPDAEIAAAAALIGPGPLLGHCSGATGLGVLGPREAFSLHPLMTVTRHGATFTGAAAAIDGTSPRARRVAGELAARLGMVPIAIAAEDRGLYHAAASVASNFLVTLELAAETLAAGAGVERRHLVPLVRATVENWAEQGAAALTGPVARGDAETVARQRAAIDARIPTLVPLFDSLVEATRAL